MEDERVDDERPAPCGLTCNYLVDPLGVETHRPRLGWKLGTHERGQRQTACQILVASTRELLARDEGDVWDSGVIRGASCVQVPYGGAALQPRARYWWKVRVWDKDGRESPWSGVSFWEMGISDVSGWRARWITEALKSPDANYPATGHGDPAPMFRREFALGGEIREARAYISGLGYYELRLNGEKVGDHLLDPAFTRYDKTVLYQAYDVTRYLRRGKNAVGVVLGDGWYNCFTADYWYYRQAAWRDSPKLLMELTVTMADGRELTLGSDLSWRVTTAGPIVFDGLRNGEIYDARRTLDGWDRPGFDDGAWANAVTARLPGGTLASQQMTPIRKVGELAPEKITEIREGVVVYDFGRNIAGWAKLTAEGPAGAELVLRYAERTGADGDIDTRNISMFVKSGEFQTDRYRLRGAGEETWEPRFTYHGFRYVQVTGDVGCLKTLRGCDVHTDLASRGGFSCSSELLNRIQECARRSLLSNYHGMPTDCPHREKNGWTGDAQLSSMQMLYNFDPLSAYEKWMHDFTDAQRQSGQLPGIVPTAGWGYNFGSGPAWDSAAFLIPWGMYLFDGDLEILRRMYGTMTSYLGYLGAMETDGIVAFGLGDWCPPKGRGETSPLWLTDTAYYCVDARVVCAAARALGKKEDEAKYGALAERIRSSLWARYLERQGSDASLASQTSLACLLYQRIAPPEAEDDLRNRLAQAVKACGDHIDCGILGARYLLPALTEGGLDDLAFRVASQETYPSWGRWIRQGATTLWEDWEGASSRNHHMFGSISAWFYGALAGIRCDPAAPGFRHILIDPRPAEGLTSAEGWHETQYGEVRSAWRIENGRFMLDVTIPPNTTAAVTLPGSHVTESGAAIEGTPFVTPVVTRCGRQTFETSSGIYRFESLL